MRYKLCPSCISLFDAMLQLEEDILLYGFDAALRSFARAVKIKVKDIPPIQRNESVRDYSFRLVALYGVPLFRASRERVYKRVSHE